VLAQIQARREQLRAEGALPALAPAPAPAPAPALAPGASASASVASDGVSQVPACPVCQGLGWYRLAVPIGHARFGEAIRCECKRTEDAAVAAARAVRASNLRGDLLSKTFEGYVASPETRPALAAVRAFTEEPKGWLLLVGSYGCGKTHLLAACANALLAAGRHPLYVEVPAWLDYVRGGYDEEDVASGEDRAAVRLRQAIEADVLLLDDLGAESRTAWTRERLFLLLNARYDTAAPTVIATNLAPDDLDGRIGSRLRDTAICRTVYLIAEDWRPRRGREMAPGESHMGQGDTDCLDK
jgi:DNA replication protein DnaC